MTTGGEENGRYGPGEGSVYDYAEPQQQHLGAEGSGPQPATPATPGGGRVESSLHGLVDELDKLRETLGYSNQLAVIEQHLHALQSENDELRSYAEEAIKEAERLANLNEELQSRLRQQELDEHMGAVLAETQKLRDVADEFEKDIVLQKLEEVEERVAEIEGLKGRVRELEEENVALTQTLNEYRESTEQLQRLRMMENGGSGEEGTGAGLGFGAAGVTAGAAAVTAAAVAAGRKSPVKQQRPQRGFSAPQENGTVLPGQQGGADFNRSATVPNSSSPRSHSASMGAALPPRAHAGSSRDPARLAEQLAAAAGGADVGVVASAAKCLRDYAALETALTHERQECERVRLEVEELRDTMFSKTFKPPSAWAEREVKYKMEKKAWEDKHKDLAQRLGEAEREVAEYRAAGKAAQWEERIHELEAQLLQTERQKDDARAQLHELQLSLRSISNSPEMQQRYSTYKPGAMQSDGGEGVLGVVAQLEQHRIGMDPPPGSQTPPRLGAEASHGSEVGASFSEQGEASPGRPKSDKLRALAQDRASADAAWEEHNKRSDVAGLRRSKAELETKVSMLEQQINKMQWAIEHADEQQAAIEEQLDTALKTGDVMNLTTIRDKIKAGLASPSKVFRRGKGGPSPNKAAMSKQLHQTTDALRSSEAEKNALRRQLAKLSRKYKEVVVAGAGATGGAAGAAAAAAAPGRGSEGAGASGSSDVQQQSRPASLDSARSSAASAGGGPAAAPAAAAPAAAAVSEEEAAVLAAVGTLGAIDEFDTEDVEEYYGPGVEDSEMEILALREENELLMDQLVTTKVRLAETEGDFLRSKRELLRAKEKRQELEERLAAAHQAQQQEQSQATLQPLGSGSVALPSPTQSVASLGTSFLAPEDSSLAAPALSREYSTGSVGGPGASMGTAGSMGAGAATSVSAGTSAGAAPGPLRAAAMGGGPLQAAMSGGGGLATAGDSGGAGNVQAPAPAPAAHRSSSWIRGLKF